MALRSRRLRDHRGVHLANEQRPSAASPSRKINLGMPPTFGGTQRLPRWPGASTHWNYCYRRIRSRRRGAREIGLVNAVVPQTNCAGGA